MLSCLFPIQDQAMWSLLLARFLSVYTCLLLPYHFVQWPWASAVIREQRAECGILLCTWKYWHVWWLHRDAGGVVQGVSICFKGKHWFTLKYRTCKGSCVKVWIGLEFSYYMTHKWPPFSPLIFSSEGSGLRMSVTGFPLIPNWCLGLYYYAARLYEAALCWQHDGDSDHQSYTEHNGPTLPLLRAHEQYWLKCRGCAVLSLNILIILCMWVLLE